MAAAVRKKNTAKPAKKTAARKRPPRKGRSARKPVGIERAVLPAFLSFCILICIAALVYLGYEKAAASNFFRVEAIDISGTERADRKDIENIVRTHSEREGIWNADLVDIKIRIEKMPFVKSASVSRILPNGIRVNIYERVPVAIIRQDDDEHLLDEEGLVITKATKPEENIPFALVGWDKEKSEKADKENTERLKLYREMLNEWNELSLAKQVKFVNIKDIREPLAVTEDSGQLVVIGIGRSNFGENLKNGIAAIAGKGATFGGVNLVGGNMRLVARDGNSSNKGN